MTRLISRAKLQRAIATASIIVAFGSGSRSLAQMSTDGAPGAPIQQPPPAMSPDELTNLVAPIALYPDALLGQILVACTYPLEVVEAQQWLQQNRNLPSRELLVAAQRQNWDPSVQALVAFPDVLALLNQNVRWTTDLGNAFLAQQSDVMNAIQSLRAEARGSGQLVSTPQLSVNLEAQGDQRAIEIQPANPQAMYVPFYNPSVVWGPPAAGSYPALSYAGSGFGSLFSTIVNLAGFLPGFQGLLGLKSWGWALSWLAQALFVNNSFFNDFGFQSSGSGYAGSSLWVHNAHHRLGIPYGSRLVASRYGGTGAGRPLENGWRTFGNARVASAREPRQPFAPRPSTASQSFQRDSRTPSTGQSARTFSQPPRTTTPTNNRSFQSAGIDPYLASSANSRVRSFPSERSFTSSRSFASSHDAFANRGSTRKAEPSRSAKSSSWHLPHFSKAHLSSHGSSSERGFSSHSFKQKHFSAPKFKAPHAPKFHGGGHSSWGHSGSGSHRG